MLGELMREFPGKIRLVFKDFPLPSHEGARPAAEAARCAAAGGRFWGYHDLLFAAQPAFAREDLITYADRVGLERGAFVACLGTGHVRAAVQRDVDEGRALGVRGTPTFFVNGRRLVGAHPLDTFRQVVQEALAGRRGP